MNREEFLKKLSEGLNKLPDKEKKDIIYDYEEHFDIALQEGKNQEEVSVSLGDPNVIAREFSVSYIINRAEENRSTGNIFRAVFATVSLGFFNLIFVLGPFIGLIGVLIGLFAASAALTISGVLLLVAILLYPILPWFVSVPHIMISQPIGGVFLSIGIFSLGLLFLIGVSYLAIGTYKITIKYLKFNIRIITDRRVKNEH
ncbi:HAAS signaling domain-containing protein [Alkaliphilus peptidifermentans]|uniref:Uncharacterized membrane protein n=1 Tax=Alkaliphilus peptidifermentans DSM 18978 TaxID=1120976 RepID=A0A1G5EWP9_9FIRM|nr:DUF1700 domain-containing protein [Alkaliphilus peptidifermentans]SCY31392.1 Uncharacterized membrane protein [Alkaliphilus peptidifermentans DSM 18978]